MCGLVKAPLCPCGVVARIGDVRQHRQRDHVGGVERSAEVHYFFSPSHGASGWWAEAAAVMHSDAVP
jgi:hypothetical protein